MALAPELGEAYAARAFFRVNLRQDWAGGRADMERALALNPGDPDVMWRFARTVLGPDRPGRGGHRAGAAGQPARPHVLTRPGPRWPSLYLALERIELARSAALRSLELWPEQDSAPIYLATAELLEHRPEAAIAAAHRSVEPVFHLQFEAAGVPRPRPGPGVRRPRSTS